MDVSFLQISFFVNSFFLSFFLSCLVDIDDGVLLLYSRRSSMRVFHDLPYNQEAIHSSRTEDLTCIYPYLHVTHAI